MKKQNQTIITTVLESDSTVSDHQRESVMAVLNGKPPPTRPSLMTQAQVALTFGVSRQTVWAMVKNGALHPIKLTSGLFRYRSIEVEAIVANGTEPRCEMVATGTTANGQLEKTTDSEAKQ